MEIIPISFQGAFWVALLKLFRESAAELEGALKVVATASTLPQSFRGDARRNLESCDGR